MKKPCHGLYHRATSVYDPYYPCSRHIWVITNHLTKERHFVPCQDMTASHLARMFSNLLSLLMGFLLPLYQTVVHSSQASFGQPYASNWALQSSFQLLITQKLTAKSKGQIKS